MLLDRAIEIVNSPGEISVHYGKEPVWIESIQTGDQKAHVRFLNSDKTMDVSVNALKEV